MNGGPSLVIDELVVPGLSARDAERLAADLRTRLGALEAADRASGVHWRQPANALSLTIECGPGGEPDAAMMAAAIRYEFIRPAGAP